MGLRRGLLRWHFTACKQLIHQSSMEGHWQNQSLAVYIYLPGVWKDFPMTPANRAVLMTANEAASATGVPLRQVHRIIDAGLLDGVVRRRRNTRWLPRNALVGLRLAHDTADLLTLETRRIVVASLLRRARPGAIRADAVVVDARPAARAVRDGLKQLAKARQAVSSSPEVLGGSFVFKGTRIPVHDIADMLANGDTPATLVRAYPQLDKERVRLAAIYAAAYPRRGRPPVKSAARSRRSRTSETLAFDLLRA
jgi:uncharacterized protein (DUF433 family)